MNVLIVSDIHGDYVTLSNIIKKETYDKIIILGDLFSYSYSKEENKKIIDVLETTKSNMILIKGNCDVFDNYNTLPRSLDIITIPMNKHLVTFTHGNKYNKGFLPSNHGDIFFSGHTHVPSLIKENNIVYANPGSIGKPRNGSSKSYILFSEEEIIIKTNDNLIIKKIKLQL